MLRKRHRNSRQIVANFKIVSDLAIMFRICNRAFRTLNFSNLWQFPAILAMAQRAYNLPMAKSSSEPFELAAPVAMRC